MRTLHTTLLSCLALSAALCVAGADAHAQGKSHGKEPNATSEKRVTKEKRVTTEKHATTEKRVVAQADDRRGSGHAGQRTVRTERVKVVETRPAHVKPAHAKPAHGRKVVTTDRAIVVTREVLVKHGYEVVRVETVRGARVVYYRRGNMGRGRGKGPIVRMVIRPAEERVVFESAPRGLLAEINIRLGM